LAMLFVVSWADLKSREKNIFLLPECLSGIFVLW